MGAPPLDPEIEAIYEELRRSFVEELPGRLRRFIAACSNARSWGARERAEAREEAHQLAGSTRVFGIIELSLEAHELEDLLAVREVDESWLATFEARLVRFGRAAQGIEGLPSRPPAG